MLGNGGKMSLVFHRILGHLVLGWAPNHFVVGAQLALCKKRLVNLLVYLYKQCRPGMKCSIMLHFICIFTVCKSTQDFLKTKG